MKLFPVISLWPLPQCLLSFSVSFSKGIRTGPKQYEQAVASLEMPDGGNTLMVSIWGRASLFYDWNEKRQRWIERRGSSIPNMIKGTMPSRTLVGGLIQEGLFSADRNAKNVFQMFAWDYKTESLKEQGQGIPIQSNSYDLYYRDDELIRVALVQDQELTEVSVYGLVADNKRSVGFRSPPFDKSEEKKAKCPGNLVPVDVSVKTDRFPGENYWQLTAPAANETLITSGGPYTRKGWRHHEDQVACVDVENECYIFTIFDDFGDVRHSNVVMSPVLFR